MTDTQGLHHVALLVADLGTAESFYAGVLGLSVTRRQAHSVWLDAGGGVLLMLEQRESDGPRDPKGPGWHMVAFRIASANRGATQQALEDAGVAIVDETPHTLYVRDPEGNLVGLSHYPD